MPHSIKKIRKALNDVLVTSLNTQQMNDLGRDVDPDFNVYEFSGFGDKIVVPKKVAADCIIQNFHQQDNLFRFIAYMITRNGQGASGGVVSLRGHEHLLELMLDNDWIFDKENARFIKNQKHDQSDDWGFMEENQEYKMSFVSIDIVASSEFIRTNVKEDVEITIGRLKQYVKRHVENWEGRLWFWYGDGGMAAFHGKDSVPMSTLSMISMLLHLPVFNIIENELRPESDVKLRVGMHYGSAIYKDDVNQMSSADMRLTQEVEKHYADPNSIAASVTIYKLLPDHIRRHFVESGELEGMDMFKYLPG